LRRSGTLLIGLVTVALAALTILLAIPITVVVDNIPASVTAHKLGWIVVLALAVGASAAMTWWLWYKKAEIKSLTAQPHPDPPPVIVGEIPLEPTAFVARLAIGRLAEAAESGRAAVVCAVTGMRGVGKTQVAAAYARARTREGWRLIGWVNAESRDVLQASLARVADAVGVADPDGDSAESARLLRDHLESRTGPGLVVFDNATDPEDLRPFLPASGSTQLVVTSTDRAFAEWGTAVDVSTFSRAESVEYLVERTRLEDEFGADDVADELGDLPLALAQAASTISRRRWTFTAYLNELALIRVEELLGRVPGGDYPRSAAAALLMSVQSTEEADPSGLTNVVLRVAAVLSADGVRRGLLEGLPDGAGSVARDVDTVLERCAAASLLTWSVTGDAVIMHRLLRRVIRERDQAGGLWRTTVEAALDVLEGSLVPEDQAWARRAEGTEIALQVEALWGECNKAESADLTQTERILRQRSWAVRQLRGAADFGRAVSLGTTVLADCLRVLGPDHPQILTSRTDLGVALRAAGRLDEATPLLEQNLADHLRLLGPEDPQTLESGRDLAIAYRLAGQQRKAIALLEQDLADRLRVLGPEDPQTLTSQNSLAVAYRQAGRLAESITLLEQTLALRDRVLGPEDPQTLISQNDLADAYREAGRLSEAIPLLDETLTDRLRVLGRDHPQTLTSRNDLAFAYREAGRLDEAIPLYEQNLAQRDRVLGSDHPATQMSRNNLAFAYREAGRLDQAIPLYEQNLADRLAALGSDHPETLMSRNNLGMAYLTAGRTGEAIELLQQNLADRIRVLGPDHPRTVTSRGNLGMADLAAGRTGEAIELLEQSLADRLRILGPDHPKTLTSRNDLADAHREAGQLDKAIPLYEQNLADRLRILGPDHPKTLTSRANLDDANCEGSQADRPDSPE
jgi:tetratricopeptide (TPR) repeat protein